MQRFEKLLKNRLTALTLISLSYLLLSLFLFDKYGVMVVTDSPRYLDYASALTHGFYFDPLNFWSLSYVLFILLFQAFTTSLTWLIVGQYLLGYVAVIALFRTVEIISKDVATACFGSILFILLPDNIYWHSYILTESLYSSFLCLSMCTAVIFWRRKSMTNGAFLTICTLVCFFCKPTAPAWIIALAFPVVLHFMRDPSYRIWKFTGLVALGVALALLADQMVSMHKVMLIYRKGDLIFAMHQLPHHWAHELLRVSVPNDLHVPDASQSTLLNIIQFGIANPLHTLKLFLGKLLLFITHLRPYWSDWHNIYAASLLWPSYYLCVRAFKRELLPRPLATVAITYVFIHTIIVSTTWADWDARFVVPLLPLVAGFAAIGAGSFPSASKTANRSIN